jgi:PAS domain S-box-containing protein
VRKDGSRFWSNGVLTALYTESGQLRGFAKITRDLTERYRLEERLKQLAAIVQSSDDAIVSMSLNGIIQTWNSGAEQLYGYSATEAIGKPFSILVLDERVGRLLDRLARIAKGEYTEPYETVRVKKDGKRINVAARFSPVRDSNGLVIGVSATSRDISDRKRLDEALRASEARNRQIVETATEGIWTIDAKAETTFVNRRMADMLGYTAEEMMGRSLFSLLHERDRGQAIQRLEQLRQGAVAPFDMVLHRKDGTEVVTIVSATRFLDEEGRFAGALAMITDISERKKLEEQLRQSQKMEAIGQLAGGVAHDFNNLLTIINGFSEMVAMKLRSDDPNRKMLQEVTKAGERAASLTRQLLAFSRKQVLEPRVLDLNAVVTDIEKMLQRLIGEDMVMTTVLAPGLRQVNVDPGQIEQIVMNLAVNARDAMPTGGKLTIETKNVDLDETYNASRPEVIPGRYVMLAVSDTGCGMTPEIQAHIFEPFFTTKGPGKGTGLGLATVYGIVKQSGGFIYLYSEPGRGTAFKIYLPAVEKRESEKSLHGVKLMPHGTETILLVEDEDAVRAVSRFALQTFGYNVLEANRPTEAIRLCEQHQGPIALLVTDIVMPGMGGRALTERISELRPGIKVLYVSGYTDDAVVRHGVLQADVAFLQKPFTPTSLANKVRQVLDQTLPVGLTPQET